MKISPRLQASLVIIIFLSFGWSSFAQDVGIGTVTPLSTFDIQGVNNNGAVTSTDGLIPPRVSDLAIPGAQNGQMVYLMANYGNYKKGFYNWNGTSWVSISKDNSPDSENSFAVPDVVIPGTPMVESFTVSPNTVITDNYAFDTAIPVAGITGNTSSVTIKINITHSWDGDLVIYLRDPTNKWLELSFSNGSSGDDYIDTIFDDAGLMNIASGSAPFTGNFQPEGYLYGSGGYMDRTGSIATLAGYNGLNPNGTWILRISDENSGDIGRFLSATLNITGTVLPANWMLIGEVSVKYYNGTAIIIKSTYSADPLDNNGVITVLARSTTSAGAVGTEVSSLPGTVLNYSSASVQGTGDFWVNTVNQLRDTDLSDDTEYFYQLWRKGNIETPVVANQTFNLVPIRLDH